LQACDWVTRDVISRYEKRVLIGNEVELGIEISMIETRKSKVSRDKGNRYRMLMILCVLGSPLCSRMSSSSHSMSLPPATDGRVGAWVGVVRGRD
jgi:hypothetical protein